MTAGRASRGFAAALLLGCPAWWAFAQDPPTAGTPAAQASALDQVMAQFAQRRHAEASFTQDEYLSVLRQPRSSTGRLIYDAPDHLEERTLTPRPQNMVLDHGMLSLKIGSRARTLRLADYPQLAPLIDSIRATMAGDRAQLERTFTLEFSGDIEHWQLHLTPRDSQSLLAQIDLTGSRNQVSEVQMRHTDGDHSIMHIAPVE
jgi:hypothetical protein